MVYYFPCFISATYFYSPFPYSHYQILVLRLSSDELPMEPPDTRYPNNSSFAMCKVINDANNKDAEYQPYVATEFSATNFTSSRKFLIGADEGEFGMATRCNNKLLSGVSYTVFVRAYPSTFYDQPELLARGREKRQTTMDIPQRQYNIFSSSRYLQPIKTSEWGEGEGDDGRGWWEWLERRRREGTVGGEGGEWSGGRNERMMINKRFLLNTHTQYRISEHRWSFTPRPY